MRSTVSAHCCVWGTRCGAGRRARSTSATSSSSRRRCRRRSRRVWRSWCSARASGPRTWRTARTRSSLASSCSSSSASSSSSSTSSSPFRCAPSGLYSTCTVHSFFVALCADSASIYSTLIRTLLYQNVSIDLCSCVLPSAAQCWVPQEFSRTSSALKNCVPLIDLLVPLSARYTVLLNISRNT